MAKKTTENKNFMSILYIAILLIFGIVFCCSVSMGVAAVSWIVGLVLIFGAISLLVSSYETTKSVATIEGLMAAAIGGFGIMFIIKRLGGWVVAYIPYILIIWGALLVLDAILFKVVKSEKSAVIFALELVLGLCSIGLGICLIYIEEFAKYSALVFGIVLICSAALQLYIFLAKRR